MTHVIIGEGNTRFIFNLGPYDAFLLSEKEQHNLDEGEDGYEYYGQGIDNRLNLAYVPGLGSHRILQSGYFNLKVGLTSV